MKAKILHFLILAILTSVSALAFAESATLTEFSCLQITSKAHYQIKIIRSGIDQTKTVLIRPLANMKPFFPLEMKISESKVTEKSQEGQPIANLLEVSLLDFRRSPGVSVQVGVIDETEGTSRWESLSLLCE